jgi:hypothetical protein
VYTHDLCSAHWQLSFACALLTQFGRLAGAPPDDDDEDASRPLVPDDVEPDEEEEDDDDEDDDVELGPPPSEDDRPSCRSDHPETTEQPAMTTSVTIEAVTQIVFTLRTCSIHLTG